MSRVKYSYSGTSGKRVHYIRGIDVEVLLGRLPEELWERLATVHFNDMSWGNRRAGYVTRGHRDITICALPPRVSMTGYMREGESVTQYGAVKGRQWPEIAVRRFLLYNAFLHELGHLQVVIPKAKNPRRKFARESKARQFASYWRKRLWQEHFEHPDPVHNFPSKQEMELLLNNSE
jgi:hypothetical protein